MLASSTKKLFRAHGIAQLPTQCLRRASAMATPLQSMPWSFNTLTPLHQSPRPGTSLAKFNSSMNSALESNNPALVYATAVKMKSQGIRPDLHTYLCLVQAAGLDCRSIDAVAILEDMTAMGVHPDTNFFNQLLKVHDMLCSLSLMTAVYCSVTVKKPPRICGAHSHKCGPSTSYRMVQPTVISYKSSRKMVILNQLCVICEG
jgi:hypothetical protein